MAMSALSSSVHSVERSAAVALNVPIFPVEGSRAHLSAVCERSRVTPHGTLATEDHPALGTLMQGLPKYLEDQRPGCFWFEEVVDMSTRINHDTGATFLHGLVDVCASLDYSIRAFVMNHSLFVA